MLIINPKKWEYFKEHYEELGFIKRAYKRTDFNKSVLCVLFAEKSDVLRDRWTYSVDYIGVTKTGEVFVLIYNQAYKEDFKIDELFYDLIKNDFIIRKD